MVHSPGTERPHSIHGPGTQNANATRSSDEGHSILRRRVTPAPTNASATMPGPSHAYTLKKSPNVPGSSKLTRSPTMLGQKRHDELPAYCKGFDVGLIPYRIDNDVKFINPLKLREYLSAGLPVVSTNMPEVQPYKQLCHIGDTGDELVAAIERALTEGSREQRIARSAGMVNETWEARVASILRVVDELEARKGQTAHDDLLGAWPVADAAAAG